MRNNQTSSSDDIEWILFPGEPFIYSFADSIPGDNFSSGGWADIFASGIVAFTAFGLTSSDEFDY